MIYIDTLGKDIYYNFAVEEYFSSQKDLGDRILLLWQTSPMLVMGRFQNISREINSIYAKEHNIGIARRRSGGGAVYLDKGSWLYTYWFPHMKNEDVDFKKNSMGIVHALASLGLELSFSDRNDILASGKKICGNARYCINGGVLHHGTLLFDTDIHVMQNALTPDSEKILSKGIRSVKSRVANIKELLDTKMTAADFGKYMIDFLSKDCTWYSMTREDQLQINRLAAKYRSWDWIYGNEPKYLLHNKKRFTGGTLSIGLDIQNGRIRGIDINGDFFCRGDIENLKRVLIGVKYDKRSIERTLYENGIDLDLFFDGITSDNFFHVVFSS